MFMHPVLASMLAAETSAEKLRVARRYQRRSESARLGRSDEPAARRRVRIRGGPSLRALLSLVRS